MVTLFLVEDEYLARNSMCKNISWEDYGIKVVGEAQDGEIALPKILELKPDILLTDIKMPFMDGLELCKLVKMHLKDIKMIILSGHDEFEYARRAISIGVNDYILKPLSLDKVLQSVLKIRNAVIIENEFKQQVDNKMKDNYEIKLKLFTHNLLNGAYSASEILEEAEALNIKFLIGAYMVVVLQIKNTLVEEALDNFKVKLHFLEFKHMEKESIWILQGETKEQLEQIAYDFEKQFKSKCKMSLGSCVNRLTDIGQSYQIAKNKIQKSEDKSKLQDVPKELILDFLYNGKEEDILEFWTHNIKSIQSSVQSFMYRCYFYTEMYFIFCFFSKEIGIDFEEVIGKKLDIESVVIQNDTMDKMITHICQISKELIVLRNQFRIKEYSLIEKAKKYIEENYGEEDINLNTVASYVHLAPSYLSALFKEKNGCNFSEYLTKVRLDEAQRLLKYSTYRTSEIAYRVGYKNPNYFSMLFKKVIGKSPSEYRTEG